MYTTIRHELRHARKAWHATLVEPYILSGLRSTSGGSGWGGGTESSKCVIEYQAFSPSYVWLLANPLIYPLLLSVSSTSDTLQDGDTEKERQLTC